MSNGHCAMKNHPLRHGSAKHLIGMMDDRHFQSNPEEDLYSVTVWYSHC